ncbi:hypothetical protein T4B_13295 [Trichinella pseudospiralis]|uniref:Uncharacterized protein n=1 Tax=Trichinella pseudospiralis TaxID=6337 RepID=A0A0V1IEG3_TRIPS|nr:hypothetical protein T4B_13295 [Trichinella pseudospiralis]
MTIGTMSSQSSVNGPAQYSAFLFSGVVEFQLQSENVAIWIVEDVRVSDEIFIIHQLLVL